MEVKLGCECCGKSLQADFSDNVWCINPQCLLQDKCFSYTFIEERAKAKINGTQPQQKERMKQGWVNEF